MNRQEIGQLLTVAGGFDNRKVDRVSVEAWALVPDIAQARYEDALAAVVAHQTGPKRHEYLTVSHIVDALAAGERRAQYQVEADIRSAIARGLVDPSWPRKERLDPATFKRLADARKADIALGAMAVER